MASRKGFTLVELLTVIGIIAILMAVVSPVFAVARAAAMQNAAIQGIRQLWPATQMYAVDFDDKFFLPYYAGTESTIAWYGTEDKNGKVDIRAGLLSPYSRGFTKDATHAGLPYKGNGMGYGYNWGYLGSSAYITDDPVVMLQPTTLSSLSKPSQTIAFATSVHYSAPWKGGDGNFYDYGFIDPVKEWRGAPSVDFRHMGMRNLDLPGKSLTSTGAAIVLFCDGSAKSRKMSQVSQAMFER
ncbi:MAG: prepilin-type N-terminal cleavage/methylation domain-containing protein [Fimbriimonadaceae bacterium]